MTSSKLFSNSHSPAASRIASIASGVGQVMFQKSPVAGLLFLAGIFIGSYHNNLPAVGWGALLGAIVATLAGAATVNSTDESAEGLDGLWGFNGALVGCALPTFLAPTWQMWTALISGAALTPLVRRAMNTVMLPWKVNSLTMPFVLITWTMLLAARAFAGLQPCGLSEPCFPGMEGVAGMPEFTMPGLVAGWLKGVSQVFLVDSWLTGLIFVAALLVGSGWRTAVWALTGSAAGMTTAIAFGADMNTITHGLYGFSPVLTSIALADATRNGDSPSWRRRFRIIIAAVATAFVQAAFNSFLSPVGMPALTAPFCLTAWIFLLTKHTARPNPLSS